MNTNEKCQSTTDQCPAQLGPLGEDDLWTFCIGCKGHSGCHEDADGRVWHENMHGWYWNEEAVQRRENEC